MRIAVAADHGGYPLKARIIRDLTESGNEVSDLGTNSADPVDYPDYARAVAEAIRQGRAERAILLCGSGAGACVAANKFAGIRAATWIASFRSLAVMVKMPISCSLVSVNGPTVTDKSPCRLNSVARPAAVRETAVPVLVG